MARSDRIDAIARDCIAVRLRRLARVVNALYDEELRPLGVGIGQLNVLVVTAKLGRARPADVARHLAIERSTLSRNLERMRARGWIAETGSVDARERPFALTRAGRDLLARAYPAWRRAQSAAERFVGAGGVRLLHEIAEPGAE